MLDLSYNGIGDEGVSALAPALRMMTKLKELSLSHNSFREGAEALAPAIAMMTELQQLDLCD